MTAYGQPPPPRATALRDRAAMVAYAAALLGVLGAIWGFLDWWGNGSGGISGYRLSEGYPVVAFPLAAGAVALHDIWRPRSESRSLLAVALSLIGMFFAIVAISVKPTLISLLELLSTLGNETNRLHLSARVGLILMLVTAILQFLVLAVGWLAETGRLASLADRRQPQAQPYGNDPSGYPPQQAYSPPQGSSLQTPPADFQTPPPGYQPPPGGYQPPAAPPREPPPPQPPQQQGGQQQ